MYDFTETALDSVHVTFTLPTFLQDTGTVITFDTITDAEGSAILNIQLIGGVAGSCGGLSAPCWVVNFSDGTGVSGNGSDGIAFNGPGTFTSADGQEALTITEVSGVPEPGSVILLLTLIAAVALVSKRRLSRDAPVLKP